MSHTLSGTIRKAPHIAAGQNSSGNYTGFFFELSEFNKGFGDTPDNYTNYSVALFPKSDAAIDFHNQAIAEGSFVVIDCDKLAIDKQEGNDGKEYIKLKMMNARLSGFNNPNQQQGQPAQNMQQRAQGGAINFQNLPQTGAKAGAQGYAQPAQQPVQSYAQQTGGAPQQMQQPNQPAQMAQQPVQQVAQQPNQAPQPANNFDSFDEDIPF